MTHFHTLGRISWWGSRWMLLWCHLILTRIVCEVIRRFGLILFLFVLRLRFRWFYCRYPQTGLCREGNGWCLRLNQRLCWSANLCFSSSIQCSASHIYWFAKFPLSSYRWASAFVQDRMRSYGKMLSRSNMRWEDIFTLCLGVLDG